MPKSPLKHPLTHYPTVYGVSYRTILRWADKNYPLDDEPATRLLVASQKNSSSAAKSSAPSHGTAPKTAPSVAPGELGLSASIRRLQEAEAETGARYRNEPDPVQAAAYRKEWLSLVEQLRRVEQSNPEVEQANKKTLRLEELQAELSSLFTLLRQDLETLPGRIALELTGKDELSIREVLRGEMDEIVLNLFHCKYLQGGLSE